MANKDYEALGKFVDLKREIQKERLDFMRRFKGFTGWLHNAETRGPEEIVEIDGAEFQRQFKELCEESERLAAKARVANQHARAGGEPELRIWPMKAPASL